MSPFSAKLLLGCFARSYFLCAAYNPRGLQNIGFIYAIEPALVALYGPGRALRKARMRYARNFNCHPFLTPMLMGMYLNLERLIASGILDSKAMANKEIMANTLSGLGDSFFSGSLLNTWALVIASLVLSGLPEAAIGLTVLAFVLLQLLRLCGFYLGLRKGMAILPLLRRLGLINWGERLKCVNALLLGAFLWLAMPGVKVYVWGLTGFYLMLAGWVVVRLHVPRVFVALILLAVTVGLHFTGLFGEIPALLPKF